MTKYIFTCEHGGNLIPRKFEALFNAHRSLLNSHRGYDIGILDVFKHFTNHFDAPNYYSDISRLLIEFNRSLNNKNLFSEITKPLDSKAKKLIIDDCYLPYRNKVKSQIEKFITQKHKVVHVSFHSFTPELNGNFRNADIGLLYDPKSINETKFCKKWKKEILSINPKIKVRYNYPYLGIADGFTSYLRKEFGNKYYCGIELEINQNIVADEFVSEILIASFKETIANYN